MATVQNPIVGRASGSLGNTVFLKYNDKNVIKSKPLEVKPSNTPAQANQRALLKKVAGLVRDLSASLSIAKRSARTGRNPKNTAKSALAKQIFARVTGTAPDRVLQPDGITLQGEGISAVPFDTVAINKTTGTFTAEWSDSLPTGGKNTDVLHVVLFNTETATVILLPLDNERDSSPASFQRSDLRDISTDNWGAFLMFDSADGLTFDNCISYSVSVA